MSTKYKFHDPEGIYFLSIAIVYWLDVFTRREYKDLIVNSLTHCSKEKGLIIYAYVIMSNHIHLLVSRKEDASSLSDVMRDFKKYTAMQCIKSIKENPQESRKEWLLWMMERAGKKNSNNTKYQFWQQDNHPIQLQGSLIDEKLDYIHRNPLEGGWACEPHEYFYSSARNYAGLESPMKIISVYDGIEI